MAFYTRAATETTDPALRELFTKFAAMEKEHMATLSRRYHAQVPEHHDGFRIERAAIYAGIDHRPEDPTNLFRIAIGFEERAAHFFAAHAEQCVPARWSASCTRSWRRRSASTSICCAPSSRAGAPASRVSSSSALRRQACRPLSFDFAASRPVCSGAADSRTAKLPGLRVVA